MNPTAAVNATCPWLHRVARFSALHGLRGSGLIWRTATRIAPLPHTGLVRTWPDLVLAFDPQDWLATEIYRGFHERSEVRILPRLVPRGGIAVDVGAHLGYYTALLSRLVGSTGRVLAFEPSPPRFEVLSRVAGSLPHHNVTLFSCALGSASQTLTLRQVSGSHSGLATLRTGADAGPEDVDVAVRRLDEVLDETNTSRVVDFLKIDVEGFEAEVLAGAGELFEKRLVRHALIEVSPQFGAVEYAVDLLERNRHTYRAFSVVERQGVLLGRPVLEPLSSTSLRTKQRQFNMLLALAQTDFAD